MKITLDIPDELLAEARVLARREQCTVDALVETGLRQVMRDRRTPFQLRDASFGGEGLQPEFRDASFGEVLAAASIMRPKLK